MITQIIHIIRGGYYDFTNKHNDLYKSRIEICKSCGHHECLGKNFGICDICGCPTSKKTRVKEEKCSLNKG